MSLSTHRLLQVFGLNDRASSERVKYYCCAIKAAGISNNTAARYFTSKAQQWERIRIASARRLMA
jgi:hypothetical protein